jgi:pimeloyl-ACP methyl ester carboxylesterase/pterin-4a-carbinolamine dehydratase
VAPIVLLHGLGSSSADWALQLPAFTAKHRVLVVDLPGHGRSPLPGGRLTIDRMADDVARLLARLEIPAAHIVGLSLGGCVGLALALRAPERVRSLVLVNAFARLRPGGVRGAVRMLRRLVLLATSPMPIVAAHVARGLFPDATQRHLYEAAVASLSAVPRRAYAAACGALAGFDVRTRLGGMRCPTLVIAGGRDSTVPLAAKEALARAIPGARLVTFDGSGHATNVDQPERFNDTVLQFVGAVDHGLITGMKALAQETCVPCRGDSPALTKDELRALLPEIPEWSVVEHNGVPRLERIFRFPDFARALQFTNRVGALAESEGHHPALLTEWGRVTVSWWTHAINGLHRNDFVMAARTDALPR